MQPDMNIQRVIYEMFSGIVFSRDVTAAMLVSLNKGTATMLCPQLILRELNSIPMQTFSFVLVENMLTDHVSENAL